MVLEESIPLPVVRPLIGLDKTEIITLARYIGTYDMSVTAAPSCQLVPATPATAATLTAIHQEEERLDVSQLVRTTVQGVQMEKL